LLNKTKHELLLEENTVNEVVANSKSILQGKQISKSAANLIGANNWSEVTEKVTRMMDDECVHFCAD